MFCSVFAERCNKMSRTDYYRDLDIRKHVPSCFLIPQCRSLLTIWLANLKQNWFTFSIFVVQSSFSDISALNLLLFGYYETLLSIVVTYWLPNYNIIYSWFVRLAVFTDELPR